MRLELRQLLGQRTQGLGLLLVLPFLLFGTAAVSALAFFGIRALARTDPGLLLPLLSAAATAVGLLWALSPLLSGLALAEAHDLSRLLFFPIPFPTLLASSLVANLLEPATLLKLPVVVAACVALGGPSVSRPLVLILGLLAFVLTLAVAQTVGLVLHALHRNRRLHDRALFVGLALGFFLSLLPFLLLYGGRTFRGALRAVIALDVFVLSPWAWPVRGAVHASRGELLAALLWAAAGGTALALVVGLNAAIARRLYEGELELGRPAARAGGGRPFRLPGEVGALFEKDLRLYWRDPRLKAMLFTSVMSPVILLLLWRGAAGAPPTGFLVFLAAFSGLSALGGNAFALERRGLLLLLSFPVDRFAVLVGKNLAAMSLRLPSLLALAVVCALLAPPGLLLPLLATAVIALLLGAATDNALSILHPVPVPAPGGNPYAAASGGRGLLAALLSGFLMMVALFLASPFVFLAFLPVLLSDRRLLLLTVPMALAGAAACYLLLVKAAAGLLTRREPELLARVLAEE
jgi:ABC-2 type transport system permease protein